MTKQEELQLKIKKKCQEDLLAFSIATDKNFIPYWHHRLIAEKLEAVERGEIKRLIITLPPRSGKSFLITEKFPTWFLGKNPGKEAIVVSYSAELAEAFGFKSRDLVRGENYGAIFDTKLRDDSKAKDKWNLSNGSQYKAVGFNGSLTGHGGHVIIIDDPIKNNSEAESLTFREGQWTWYTSTLYTRLYANAPVVLVMTRWHLDDLAGRLVEQQKYGGDMWEVINIPALAMQDEEYDIKGKKHIRKRGEPIEPALFTREEVEQKKSVLGSYYFSSLYQGMPISDENQEFKEAFFQYIELDEVLKMSTRRFMTIDTAISKKASADFTGVTLNFVDKEGKWYIMTWKKRMSPGELMNFIFEMWEKYHIEKIGVEKTIYLMAIKTYFDEEMRKRNQFPHVVELQHHYTNKEGRIRSLIPYYESSTIIHIKGHCEGLEEELLTFPKGRHDDVIDALAYQKDLAKKPFEQTDKKVHVFKPISFR